MKIIGSIETIAEGHGIRELATLRQSYGDGNWKKKKGIAMFDWITVTTPKQRFIGMKPTA